MDDTLDWLRGRPYYEDQLVTHERRPGRAAEYAHMPVDSRLEGALGRMGIDDLYRHQAEAIRAHRNGANVVLASPTASGKSLAYTIPAVEHALDDKGCTLYIGPQVALINDQEATLSALADGLGFGSGVQVAQYTGRLSKSEKRSVRDRQPTVLLTTPDMLHFGILPHAHRLWDWFFQRLELIVLDEVHDYRGVFGSHVALVLRRLNRLAERFEADPQVIGCSATIRNPIEHASALTGRPESTFTLVDADSSATGPTHWAFWNPPEYHGGEGWGGSGRRRSNHVESKRLFTDLVARGYQTVVFTAARQAAERYATESADALRERGETELAAQVTAYQAALGRDRRSAIESGLQDGSIRGVWSTNALELGVDIGGLDVVILDGYPGTRMATYQQAGRAGRGTDPSLVVLVAGEDQLDQYFMADPAAFFEGKPERAVVNPNNEELLPDHVRSAARENWLNPDDDAHFGPHLPHVVHALETSGDLERRDTADGVRWTFAGDGSPQHDMSLRSIQDRSIRLLDTRSENVIGRLPFDDALRDAHRGAIYHHQGRAFQVTDLDLDRDRALLTPTHADYYTRVLHEKTITVAEDHDHKPLETADGCTISFADVTMRKQITGFERRDTTSGESLGRESLELPELTLETTALYLTIPPAIESAIRARDGDYLGAIHAAEHAMIAMFPLELLCDRRDIGGLSTPMHPHTDRSTIFIYDGYPGGVGLARAGFDRLESLMGETRAMVLACGCEDGCPACVQSPHCGNANEPLEKDLAIALFDALLGRD